MIDRSFLKELGLDPVVTIDASFTEKPFDFSRHESSGTGNH